MKTHMCVSSRLTGLTITMAIPLTACIRCAWDSTRIRALRIGCADTHAVSDRGRTMSRGITMTEEGTRSMFPAGITELPV